MPEKDADEGRTAAGDDGPSDVSVLVWASIAAGAVAAVLAVLLASSIIGGNSDSGSTAVRTQARLAATAVRPPAGLPKTGSYLESRVLPNGDLLVTQWIRSKTLLSRIDLAAPAVDGRPDQPTATNVSLVADGKAVKGTSRVGRRTVTYDLDFAARLIYLRYTLHDAIDRSTSVKGRALARVTSLDVGYEPRWGPTTVNVIGARVLSTACVRTASLSTDPRPCGSPAADHWQIELRGSDRDDRVMAQLDLG